MSKYNKAYRKLTGKYVPFQIGDRVKARGYIKGKVIAVSSPTGRFAKIKYDSGRSRWINMSELEDE